MKPWSRRRRARWLRRYLAVDSRRYAGRALCHPWWLWFAFQASLWLAWRLRWPWLSDLAFYFCRPAWVGMGGYAWDVCPQWLTKLLRKDEAPF